MDGLAAASRVVAEELQTPDIPEDGSGQKPSAPEADPDPTEGEKDTA
jgi:hypothetical protein